MPISKLRKHSSASGGFNINDKKLPQLKDYNFNTRVTSVPFVIIDDKMAIDLSKIEKRVKGFSALSGNVDKTVKPGFGNLNTVSK